MRVIFKARCSCGKTWEYEKGKGAAEDQLGVLEVLSPGVRRQAVERWPGMSIEEIAARLMLARHELSHEEKGHSGHDGIIIQEVTLESPQEVADVAKKEEA